MVIFDGFVAGFICGVCITFLFLFILALHHYYKMEELKAKFLGNITNEITKGETKSNESNN